MSFLLGILTMSVDMETYERAGLVGKPEGAKTKGGKRSRWSRFAICAF